MRTLAFASCVRGYHVYKDRWTPVTNEELACQREPGNIHNPYAVSVTLVLLPSFSPRHNILYVLVCSRHELHQVPMRVWKRTRNRLEIPLPRAWVQAAQLAEPLWPATPTN